MSEGYLGNQNLKKIGSRLAFNQQEIDEYVRCAEDPAHFIKNHCKIVSLDDGLVPFRLYGYQEKFIDILQGNRWVISMQPRQSGKSQLVAAYILWFCIFHSNTQSAILANKASAAREILSRFKLMYEYLPKFLQQGVKTWNKGDVELENGAKVFCSATTGDGLRGKSLNFVYMDETALVANNVFEEFFTSTYPTISSGKTTKIVMTSTPIGYNHFWKFWSEAEKGINGFVPLRVHYWDHPKRDKAWADEQLRILGQLKFNQEILCEFLGSSNTLIRSDVVGAMAASKPIYSKDGFDVFEGPLKRTETQKAHSYVIVVDPSKGIGNDSSAFSVFDISESPYRVVAKYKSNEIAPLLFPSVIYKYAHDYNEAWVLFEINVSEQIPHIMYYELEYENILFVARGRTGQAVSAGFGGASFALGVTTDKKVKRIGCQNLKALLEENQLLVSDADTIHEISTFVQVKDSYAADDGYHDDLVMTLVLFAWLTTQDFFKDLVDIDMRKVIYQKRIDLLEEDVVPIGFYNNGIPEIQEEVLNF